MFEQCDREQPHDSPRYNCTYHHSCSRHDADWNCPGGQKPAHNGAPKQLLSLLKRALERFSNELNRQGIHKKGEAVDSASVQDGGNDGLFERS
jgi:hypothetical protein